MTDLALDLAHVSKTYKGRIRALQDVQMRVHRGEVFGLLGPNGAGKSTLVKILMTVVRATRCEGTMLGDPVGHKPTLSRIGYLPEHHRFPDYLTGAQVVDFYGALAGAPRQQRRKRTGELLDLVGMSGWAKRRIKSYSKGMRQRIGIAQALVNDPQLVLLDEPTDGVDPVGRRDIRRILQQMKDEGRTVFLNSHLLSELEMVCDRVAILVRGQVAQQGTLDELTADMRRYEIHLDRAAIEQAHQIAGSAFQGDLVTREGVLVFDTVDPDEIQPAIDALRRGGMTIREIRQHKPSLEDLFMTAVTDDRGEVMAPGAENPGQRQPKRSREQTAPDGGAS
jgi:ABC-2 type transport system ATP-binding protein